MSLENVKENERRRLSAQILDLLPVTVTMYNDVNIINVEENFFFFPQYFGHVH